MLNYEKDIEIDESALDIEWLGQPSLMMKYGRNAAQARKESDLAKERLEVVKATLDKAIRTNPEKYGITKITEAVVSGEIVTQLEYQEASSKYIEAKYEEEMAIYAVRSIDQRKNALENLVRLHGQQYFAGPQIPRDLSKEWEKKEKQKQVDAGVSKAMKRKVVKIS